VDVSHERQAGDVPEVSMKWDQADDVKRPWHCIDCLKRRKSRATPCECGGMLVVRAGNDMGGLMAEKVYEFEKGKP